MKKLFKRIKESISTQLSVRELSRVFITSFLVIGFILLWIGKRNFNGLFLVEALGMAIVFVLLFAMIKVYTDLLDAYYGSFRKKK